VLTQVNHKPVHEPVAQPISKRSEVPKIRFINIACRLHFDCYYRPALQ
jgi:hypothetical protein